MHQHHDTLNHCSAQALNRVHLVRLHRATKRALASIVMLTSLICLGFLGGCADQSEWGDDVRVTSSKSNSVNVGDACSAGCVWSSYAVRNGFQPAERMCNGQKCACVAEGDAMMSCAADAPKTDDLVEEQSAGSSCGSGCVWSSYAVSQGAQSATASCDGAPCACVVSGDIWSSCEMDVEPPMSNPESNPEPNPDTETEPDPAPPAPGDQRPDVPYFYQYNNSLYPSASCQNTSIAMVLAYLGWSGTPDQITGRYGKDWAQSPAGLADLFNTYVRQEGLSMSLQPNTSGSIAGLKAELDRGHPVIIHGFFTSYGHVLVVLGYDEGGYYVNDPAGQWSGYFKGGYPGGGSGRNIYYNKSAFEAAVATSNGYSPLPLWYHALR